MKFVALVAMLWANCACGAEDCTAFCEAWFGPGVAVTIQSAITQDGTCHNRCFFANGWWFDADTGQVLRRPDGSLRDQRPLVTEVPPYGYARLNGFQINAWLDCPGGWGPRVPAPFDIKESGIVFARSEYGEGERWCMQGR